MTFRLHYSICEKYFNLRPIKSQNITSAHEYLIPIPLPPFNRSSLCGIENSVTIVNPPANKAHSGLHPFIYSSGNTGPTSRNFPASWWQPEMGRRKRTQFLHLWRQRIESDQRGGKGGGKRIVEGESSLINASNLQEQGTEAAARLAS